MSAEENPDRCLRGLLEPESIAVIGATDVEGKPGRIVFEQLLASGRTVYPVNPGRKEVLGKTTVASVSALPHGVELAIITIAAAAAVDEAEACAEKGIPYVVVLAGGFGESGAAGRALEERLRQIPTRSSTRILGPNSLGIFLPSENLDTIFVEHGDKSLAGGGGVAFITQSGSVGVESLGLASNTGFGLFVFVGLGNKCDLNELDFLRCFQSDERARCLAFYLESLDGGRAFLEAALQASRRVPVIVLKAGRSSAGATAVSSHTGRLAGSDMVVRGAFRQHGIIALNDDEELCDAAKTLAGLPAARGNRVAVLTPAGGFGVMCADYIESAIRGIRLEMAKLSPATTDRIRATTFPFASCRNPVDLTASATDGMFGGSMDALLADPGVDILICIAFFAPPQITDNLVDEIARRAVGSKVPVLVFTQYGPFTDAYLKRLYDAGVIGFPSIWRTVRAASFLVERAAILEALNDA